MFGVSWKIKAELEESIRLAEQEEPEGESSGGDEALRQEQVGSPLHNPSQSDDQAGSRLLRRSGADGSATKIPASLYKEDSSERSDRIRRASRGSISSTGSVGGRNNSASGSLRNSLTVVDMFTPAPVDDPDDRIRINSMSAV